MLVVLPGKGNRTLGFNTHGAEKVRIQGLHRPAGELRAAVQNSNAWSYFQLGLSFRVRLVGKNDFFRGHLLNSFYDSPFETVF